jgi:hypothetical protein
LRKSNKKPLKNQKTSQVCGQLKKPNLLKIYRKQPKISQNSLFSAVFLVEEMSTRSNHPRKSAKKPCGKRLLLHVLKVAKSVKM